MKNIGSCLQEGQRSSRRSEVSFHPFCLQFLNFTYGSVLSGVRTAKQPVFSPRLRTRARAVKEKVWGEGGSHALRAKIECLSFTYTANVKFKSRISQNRT